jgi:hypothetical protein
MLLSTAADRICSYDSLFWTSSLITPVLGEVALSPDVPEVTLDLPTLLRRRRTKRASDCGKWDTTFARTSGCQRKLQKDVKGIMWEEKAKYYIVEEESSKKNPLDARSP